MLYFMKKGIFIILFYITTLFPNIVLAADTTSSKIAENPFYECLSGDISNPKNIVLNCQKLKINNQQKFKYLYIFLIY